MNRGIEVGSQSHRGQELEEGLKRGVGISLRRLWNHAKRLGWKQIKFQCCQL